MADWATILSEINAEAQKRLTQARSAQDAVSSFHRDSVLDARGKALGRACSTSWSTRANIAVPEAAPGGLLDCSVRVYSGAENRLRQARVH